MDLTSSCCLPFSKSQPLQLCLLWGGGGGGRGALTVIHKPRRHSHIHLILYINFIKCCHLHPGRHWSGQFHHIKNRLLSIYWGGNVFAMDIM